MGKNTALPKSNRLRALRLFLALWPDVRVLDQLAAHTRQWTWPTGCVRYAPADWHLTLHFIGSVNADQLPDMVASARVPLQPFELILNRPELWHSGLAVLSASEVPKPLQTLHHRLGNALRGLDLPVESRALQPHITLARHANAAIPPVQAAPVAWWVQGFSLAVTTGDKDSRYRVIHKYP